MTLDIDASIQVALNRLKDDTTIFQIPDNPQLDNQIRNAGSYTESQANLLLTHAPFAIGTAGAGCGKTHTLVGRLKYLNDLGVTPQNIMNLSFSNAAVDNLKARFPEAQVSTIASMCQDLYKLNFNQNVKFNFYPITFMNAVACTYIQNNRTYTDQHAFPVNMSNVAGSEVANVKYQLQDIYRRHYAVNYTNRTPVKEFTRELFELANTHFNALNVLLHLVRQIEPSLSEVLIQYELENNPDNFNWTDSLRGIEVITLDECQDTSTIEMLLMLNMAKAHKAQLFLVGDANQTLFEWRSADPEMIATLQKHPAFTNYNLDTNFRSKQAILLYANVILKRLTTNQVNPIELHDLDETNVTVSEFKQANTISLNTNFYDEDTMDWIRQCLDKHEQVAILGQGHKDIDDMTNALKYELNRPYTIIDMTNKMEPPIDYISGTIASLQNRWLEFMQNYYGENLLQAIYTFIADEIATTKLNLSDTNYDNGEVLQAIGKALNIVAEDEFIQQRLWNYCHTDKSTARIMALIMRRMIVAEIDINDAAQQAQQELNQEKQDADLSQYDIITSTIHSAKGLEFDHVLIIYNETGFFYRDGADQGQLRALGVALTRAKLSQHVLEISDSSVYKNNLQALANYEDFSARPLVTGYQLFLDHAKNNTSQNQDYEDFVERMKKRAPKPFNV